MLPLISSRGGEERRPLFILPTMPQFEAFRYSPLGHTKSWTSPRRRALQVSALTALTLATVIVFGSLYGVYEEYNSRATEARYIIIPSSSQITTTTTTVTVTSIPTPTGHQNLDSPDWSFDPQRDSKNYGLSASQCNVAFQPLFNEITRASKFTQQNGRVSPSNLDISWTKQGAVHALIQDRQVSLKKSGCKHR
jgi:hypothetical protein